MEPAALDRIGAGRHPRARTARAAGGRGRAARLPARGLLGLHGHLQGQPAAERAVGERPGPLALARQDVSWRRHDRPRHRRAGVHRLLARQPAARRGRAGRGAAARRPGRVALRHRGARAALRRRPRRPRGLRVARPGAERVRGEGRLPPGRADDRRHGEPLAALHLRDEHPRHVPAARGLPRRRRGGRRRSSGSWSRPPTRPTATTTSFPTARTSRSSRATRTTCRRRPPT